MVVRFIRLTRPEIRKIKPGQKITEVGITAERLTDSDVRYSVNVMVDGTRIHRVIGLDSEGVTRTQAETFIEAKRTEAREDRLGLPSARKTPMGFAQAADDYLARLKDDPDAKNVPRKAMHLGRHLKPFFKQQRLTAITEFTIQRYKRDRAKQGAAAGTINRELTTLIHLLHRAVAWRWLKAMPCEVKKGEESEGRIIALTDEQADALVKAAIADQDPDCWLFVVFGLNTAMRHGEILRARFERVNFETRRLHIPTAKAGAREQPITTELRDILAKERDMRDDQDGWIFPAIRLKLSGAGHRTRMDRPFRRAVKQAKLDPEKITPHVMRHTAITNLVQGGNSLATVKMISGHKTLEMVLRYTHAHDMQIDEAMGGLGRAVPERKRNENPVTTTPELHIVAKQSA